MFAVCSLVVIQLLLIHKTVDFYKKMQESNLEKSETTSHNCKVEKPVK